MPRFWTGAATIGEGTGIAMRGLGEAIGVASAFFAGGAGALGLADDGLSNCLGGGGGGSSGGGGGGGSSKAGQLSTRWQVPGTMFKSEAGV